MTLTVLIGSFILLGLLAAVAAYLAYYFRKKRREELALMARQLGLVPRGVPHDLSSIDEDEGSPRGTL